MYQKVMLKTSPGLRQRQLHAILHQGRKNRPLSPRGQRNSELTVDRLDSYSDNGLHIYNDKNKENAYPGYTHIYGGFQLK